MDSKDYIDLVYCRPTSRKGHHHGPVKKSYGIICILLDKMEVIMTENIPYIRPTKRNKIILNYNELYNLQMSSFPNGGLTERQYVFPKGRIDKLDYDNGCEYTKVREFIEETKYYSPKLMELVEQHFGNAKFVSLLNNPDNQVYEEWIGLDENRYSVEYALFIIDSINDLKYKAMDNKNRISPFLISDNIPYCKAGNNAITNYHKKMNISKANDSNTRTVLLDIQTALRYNNLDKKQIISCINEQKIYEAISNEKNKREKNLKKDD